MKFSLRNFFTLLSVLVTLLAAWMAFDNFRDSRSLRTTNARLTDSRLRMDALRENPDAQPELTFLLTLYFTAPDRTYHWEGDAGKAVCPEEALDTFADWKVGNQYPISTIRGNSREIRFNNLEDNPEFDRGIAWTILTLMLLVITISIYVFTRLDDTLTQGHSGVWLIFVGFGLMPLIGGLALGYSDIRDKLTFVPVTIERTSAKPPDLSQLPPGVEVTPSAHILLTDTKYATYQYQRAGRTWRVCDGPTSGVFAGFRGERAAELPRYDAFIDPRNRWNAQSDMSWVTILIPTTLLLLFGFVFCGAGLLVRRSERKALQRIIRRP